MNIKEILISSIKYIIMIAIIVIIFVFVIGFHSIGSSSMEDKINEDDMLVISKLNYNFRNPKRGEIVIIKNNKKSIALRVIGLPGETIEYKDNKLLINDEEYNDRYATSNTDDFKSEEIKKDCYFLLGDNRDESIDSRELGCIKKEDILGKVVLRLYPFNKIKWF